MSTNSTLLRALPAVACLLTLVSDLPCAEAEVVMDRREAGHLVRRYYSLSAGNSITFESRGCTGSEDTVMYLLEGGSGTVITRATNDDASGLGLCSRVSYTNTTGSTHTYTLVIVAYGAYSAGSIDLYVSVNNSSFVVDASNLQFGGARAPNAQWAAGSTLLTKALRPISGEGSGGPNGRGIEDTYLFAIHMTPGSSSFTDDDSGMYAHSRIDPSAGCTTYYGCEMVAGAYSSSETGNLSVWNIAPGGADPDGDGVPTDIESFYGTSSTNADTDGDGIGDFFELLGYSAGGTAGLDGNSLILPYYDAHPTQQDIYLEIDYMYLSPTDKHTPNADLANDIRATYQDESAWTGRYIRPHIEVSDNIGHWDAVDYFPCSDSMMPGRLDFYSIKGNSAYFDPKRLYFFHYIIAGHSIFNANHPFLSCPTVPDAVGTAEIFGNDVIIALNTIESRTNQYGDYLHEIGHNLNLTHNANDSDAGNNSCVHSSVMNYRYIQFGWGTPGTTPESRRYSYSRGLCDATSDGCDNTCTAFCVPDGQATGKGTCPPVGLASFVSNGLCDCDANEWSSLRLDFLTNWNGPNTFGPASFGPNSTGEREAREAYLMGKGVGLRAEHWAHAHRKRQALLRRGLIEGRDFQLSPRNAKIYAIEH